MRLATKKQADRKRNGEALAFRLMVEVVLSQTPGSRMAVPVWDLGSQLGEGPVWDQEGMRLWFVDILKGRVHWFAPRSSTFGTHDVGGMPCFIQPVAGAQFLVGSQDTLFHFDGERLGLPILQIDLAPEHRFNDATVDGQGRLWFGSMDMQCRTETGQLHLLEQGEVKATGARAAITNGPAVSLDHHWLYHVDTSAGMILRFDLHDEGFVTHRRLGIPELFLQFSPEEGAPDGISIDAEGHIWVGMWGGWSARRYSPSGDLVQTIDLPCANVTKVAMGGEDLCTAFITTARVGLDDDDLEKQPLAGALFACRVDVPGVQAIQVVL